MQRSAPLLAMVLAFLVGTGCSQAPVSPGAPASPAGTGPARPSIVRLAPPWKPVAYVAMHAPAKLPAWLGVRQLDLENLLRPLIDRHAEQGCRQARAPGDRAAASRCPLGPVLLERPDGHLICRVHPEAGEDPEKSRAERELMLDETMARLFAGAATLGELHLAWAPGQGPPLRQVVDAPGTDPATRDLLDEVLDRGTRTAPTGRPGDWSRTPPFDALRGLEKKGAGLELAFVPPDPGRDVTLGLTALRVPESLYLRVEEGRYQLELGYADADARERMRASLADMTTLAGLARHAAGFFSARQEMLIRWIHHALQGSKAEIQGNAVVLTGSALIPAQDWQKAIVTARGWMMKKERGVESADCADQRDQLMLAGEMWQLERDGAPPPELARLVDQGMLRELPKCPAGGALTLDDALRPRCSLHAP